MVLCSRWIVYDFIHSTRFKDADGGGEGESLPEHQWCQRLCGLGSSDPLAQHHLNQHAAEVHTHSHTLNTLNLYPYIYGYRLYIGWYICTYIHTYNKLCSNICLCIGQNTTWTRFLMMQPSTWSSLPWTAVCNSKRYETLIQFKEV